MTRLETCSSGILSYVCELRPSLNIVARKPEAMPPKLGTRALSQLDQKPTMAVI